MRKRNLLISVRKHWPGVIREKWLCQTWKSAMQLTETLLRTGLICNIPLLDNAAGDQVHVCVQFIASLPVWTYCKILHTVYVLIDVRCMLDWNTHNNEEGGCQKYYLAKVKFTCVVHVLAHAANCPGKQRERWAGPLYSVCCSEPAWNVFSRDSSHRFVPVCFPALLLVAAAAPELHCAGCFFLGTGAFALPLKAFVGSSLFRCTSPVVSDELASLLNISGWYSEAHCYRGGRDRLLLLVWN